MACVLQKCQEHEILRKCHRLKDPKRRGTKCNVGPWIVSETRKKDISGKTNTLLIMMVSLSISWF